MVFALDVADDTFGVDFDLEAFEEIEILPSCSIGCGVVRLCEAFVLLVLRE